MPWIFLGVPLGVLCTQPRGVQISLVLAYKNSIPYIAQDVVVITEAIVAGQSFEYNSELFPSKLDHFSTKLSKGRGPELGSAAGVRHGPTLLPVLTFLTVFVIIRELPEILLPNHFLQLVSLTCFCT